MDIDNIKIGIDATIYPPIQTGFNFIKQYAKMGVESLWFEDHLMGWIPDSIWTEDIISVSSFYDNPNQYYDPIAIMGAVAMITKKVQLGTSVTDPFRNNPATLARAFLTLDHITNGKFIIGIGAGEKENIEPYGINWKKPVTRLRETIEIIRLFWDSKKVNYKGEIWKLEDAVIGLKPIKKKSPPIWIAAHGLKMLELIGKLGDGWLPYFSFCPSIKLYKEKLRVILKSAENEGRKADDITPSLVCALVVDEEHEECHRLINNPLVKCTTLLQPNENFKKYGISHPLGESFNGILDFIPTRYSKDMVLRAFDKITREMCEEVTLHGTPDDIIQKIEQYAEVGLKHIILSNITPFCDLKKMNASNESLEKIIKYFKK